MVEITLVKLIAGADGFFNYPSGICLHRESNLFYIADMHNQRICWLSEDGRAGVLSNVVASNGSRTSLCRPLAVWITNQGILFTADAEHNKIFYKTQQADVWKSILVDSKFPFNLPGGVTVDERGNVYTNDFLNNRLVQIDPNGKVTILLDSEGNINKPYGIFYQDNKLYYTDTGNARICYIDLVSGQVNALMPQIETKGFSFPIAITLDDEGNIYICEQRSMYFLDIEKNILSLIIDKDIWKAQMKKHSIPDRICHMGALTVRRKGEVYWVDTIKGYIYRMILDFP